MTKKDFKQNNPALAYMSTPEEEVDPVAPEEETVAPGKAPSGYKLNPQYVEVKSRRVQLLLQPSVVDALKELASERGLSMNETANEAIKEYLERSGRNGRKH